MAAKKKQIGEQKIVCTKDIEEQKLKKIQKEVEKKEILTLEEREKQENYKLTKVATRNVQDIDLDLTQEQLNLLSERNEKFASRSKTYNANQKRTVDMSLTTTYEDKCEDVYNWIQKMFREWYKDNETKPRGYADTHEGRKNLDLYRETKRNLINLYEIL